MNAFLEFDCTYGCGQKIAVDVSNWGLCRDADGTYPRERVYKWLGCFVFNALLRHQLRDCPNYREDESDRPWLRLVKST